MFQRSTQKLNYDIFNVSTICSNNMPEIREKNLQKIVLKLSLNGLKSSTQMYFSSESSWILTDLSRLSDTSTRSHKETNLENRKADLCHFPYTFNNPQQSHDHRNVCWRNERFQPFYVCKHSLSWTTRCSMVLQVILYRHKFTQIQRCSNHLAHWGFWRK